MVSPESTQQFRPELLAGLAPANDAPRAAGSKQGLPNRRFADNVTSLSSSPVSPKAHDGPNPEAPCQCKQKNQARLDHAEAFGFLDNVVIREGGLKDVVKVSEETGLILFAAQTDDMDFDERPKRYLDINWMVIGFILSANTGVFWSQTLDCILRNRDQEEVTDQEFDNALKADYLEFHQCCHSLVVWRRRLAAIQHISEITAPTTPSLESLLQSIVRVVQNVDKAWLEGFWGNEVGRGLARQLMLDLIDRAQGRIYLPEDMFELIKNLPAGVWGEILEEAEETPGFRWPLHAWWRDVGPLPGQDEWWPIGLPDEY